MPHILVLYAPADQVFARQLAVQLDQRGLVVSPVPDPTGLMPVQPVDPQLEFENASHVLGIVSPEAAASAELMARCQEALDRRKRVIAVQYKACDLPEKLHKCPVVNFEGHFLLAVEELVKRLEKTGAPTRTLSVINPPPVAKSDLLPFTLPSERCWREDRLRINYTLPILMPQEDLELRLPVFLVDFDFELTRTGNKTIRAQRMKKRFKLFDPRRAEHSLTVKRRKGSLSIYYRMTRTQVYHWFPAHYRTLDREAAALYRYLVTGKIEGLRPPVNRQAQTAQFVSWATLIAALLILILLIYLITL